MVGDYKKIMAWQLSEEMKFLINTEEFQNRRV
jgi:hypothetical protein